MQHGWDSIECAHKGKLQEDLNHLSEIDQSLVIFCLATYGEGDPTDNAQQLHEYLQSGDADLAGVRYAVSLR